MSKGNAKQYRLTSGSRTVHSENGVFFANVKASKDYKKNYVPKEEVYELPRYYKTNQANLSSLLEQPKKENQDLGIWSCISRQVNRESLLCSTMVTTRN